MLGGSLIIGALAIALVATDSANTSQQTSTIQKADVKVLSFSKIQPGNYTSEITEFELVSGKTCVLARSDSASSLQCDFSSQKAK